jgi:hypothetical protein
MMASRLVLFAVVVAWAMLLSTPVVQAYWMYTGSDASDNSYDSSDYLSYDSSDDSYDSSDYSSSDYSDMDADSSPAATGTNKDPKAPSFIIDLDQDPTLHFTGFPAEMYSWMPGILQWMYDDIGGKDKLEALYPLARKMMDTLKPEYVSEMKGFCKEAQANGITDMVPELSMMLQLVYEISSACTSIVANDADGNMLHARNLDFPIPYLQNITYQADFRRNNKTVYKAATFLGEFGVLTGMVPGGFSVSVNERRKAPLTNVFRYVYSALTGGKCITYAVRDIMDSAKNYSQANQMLQHSQLIANVYLTTAGTKPGEGAIITRNPMSVADVFVANPDTRYAVCQTNDDNWAPPTDPRRVACYNSLSQFDADSISLDNLYDILSLPPVYNEKLVRYTSLMNPSTGQMTTYLRCVHCNQPSSGLVSPPLSQRDTLIAARSKSGDKF